jgi:hypothetical protein
MKICQADFHWGGGSLRAPTSLEFPGGALTEGIVSITSVRTGFGNRFPAI